MSPTSEMARAVTAPMAGRRPSGALGAPATSALVHRPVQTRLRQAAWALQRVGRPGLAGLALLVASALFLVTTLRPVAAEVEALRNELTATPRPPRGAAGAPPATAAAPARALPGRDQVPALLAQLFGLAARARLPVETARYESRELKDAGVTRHLVAFPVSGPYPQIRAFIDETLATMPTVAISSLVLERKAIGDGTVEAQLRLTLYTRSGP